MLDLYASTPAASRRSCRSRAVSSLSDGTASSAGVLAPTSLFMTSRSLIVIVFSCVWDLDDGEFASTRILRVETVKQKSTEAVGLSPFGVWKVQRRGTKVLAEFQSLGNLATEAVGLIFGCHQMLVCWITRSARRRTSGARRRR